MRGNTVLAAFAALALAASLAACDGGPVEPIAPAGPSHLAIDQIDPVDPGDGGGGGGDTGGGGTGGGTTTTPTDFSTYPSTITPNVPLDYYGYTANYIRGCAQYPYVWVAPTSGNASNGIVLSTVYQGGTIYFTGIVDPGTKINFHVYNAAGQLVMTHLTQPAHDNCVVYHEPEAVSTWGLPRGSYYVFASYWSYGPGDFYGVQVLYEQAVTSKYVTGLQIN